MTYLKLNNENIETAVSQAVSFLEDARMVDKDVLRIRLLLEETMLNYQDAMGTEAEFTLKCRQRMGNLKIELCFPGDSLDPFPKEEGDSEIMRGILSQLGFAPAWQYVNGVNQVLFSLAKPRPSQVQMLLVAIEMAILCGFWGKILPPVLGKFVTEQVLMPMFDTFLGLISAVAGPMIFLAVAWGIYSIGDTAALSRIGKRMILRFLAASLIIALLTGGILLFFFPISTAGGAMIRFQELFSLILSIAPDNFLTPFTEGNPVQIIFLAALVGIAMLLLENKTAVAADVIDQSNRIVQRIMEIFSRLIPFFVFGSIFSMIVGGNFSALISMGKLLLMVVLGDLVISFLYLLLVSLRRKVPLKLLLKKALPATMIAFGSASSSAAMASNLENCRTKLGIDRKIVNFGVPLGQVVFMPGCIVLFLTAGLYMAQAYGIELTVGRLITAMIVTVMLSIAAPPVPGGALTCYTMLFLQLGIPAEAMAELITFNIVLEFFTTGTNLFTLQMELTDLAGDLDLLNTRRLSEK